MDYAVIILIFLVSVQSITAFYSHDFEDEENSVLSPARFKGVRNGGPNIGIGKKCLTCIDVIGTMHSTFDCNVVMRRNYELDQTCVALCSQMVVGDRRAMVRVIVSSSSYVNVLFQCIKTTNEIRGNETLRQLLFKKRKEKEIYRFCSEDAGLCEGPDSAVGLRDREAFTSTGCKVDIDCKEPYPRIKDSCWACYWAARVFPGMRPHVQLDY
jgi:hypothetical protein